jgi:transposase InsO family protein
MSWKVITLMSQRIEFVKLAMQHGANVSELCRKFGISRKTGYKFINRYQMEGVKGLENRSNRPEYSPNHTDAFIEHMILELRDRHPAWGGRKLKRRLEDLGFQDIPVPSTITAILKRNGRITKDESQKRIAYKRFCAENPNDLWQMDFKGHFQARNGRCYPLTILDDHSRYSLGIAACTNQGKNTVKDYLEKVFHTYGLPWVILVDNGPPWGNDLIYKQTKLTVWLMRLYIKVIHSRPYHPQTLGKDERFHRTLKAELISHCFHKTHHQCQKLFDQWCVCYNTERPHESLNMDVPVNHYKISNRSFPNKLDEIEYNTSDMVRKVQQGGIISFKNKVYKVGKPFIGQRVAIRETPVNGLYNVYFINHKIAHLKMV